VLASLGADDRVREVLNRVDRLTVLADQESEVATGARHRDDAVAFRRGDGHVRIDRRGDAVDELARGVRGFALGSRAFHNGLGNARDHPRRRASDSEQTALAFGEDLEAHVVAVEPGNELLELA